MEKNLSNYEKKQDNLNRNFPITTRWAQKAVINGLITSINVLKFNGFPWGDKTLGREGGKVHHSLTWICFFWVDFLGIRSHGIHYHEMNPHSGEDFLGHFFQASKCRKSKQRISKNIPTHPIRWLLRAHVTFHNIHD